MINIQSLWIELLERIMDAINKIPGLQHIAEDIFKLLDKESLMNCRVTNSSWKNVLEQPIFWLQKLEIEGWKALTKHIGNQQLAKNFAKNFLKLKYPYTDVQNKWKALSQDLDFDYQPIKFVLILIKIYNNQRRLFPLEAVVVMKKVAFGSSNKYLDLVESIIEHESPNTKVDFTFREFCNPSIYMDFRNATSLHVAAFHGFTKMVEMLSKKYEDPMVICQKDNSHGCNSIHLAALKGHLNIVKHLMGLTDTPLAPDDQGWTPIHYAARGSLYTPNGNLDTIRFLVGFTSKPNAPTNTGRTPIGLAQYYGNDEVKKSNYNLISSYFSK